MSLIQGLYFTFSVAFILNKVVVQQKLNNGTNRQIFIRERLNIISDHHARLSVIYHVLHLIFGFSPNGYDLVLSLSCGYALNDLFLMIRYQTEKHVTQYIIHHVIMIVGCFICMGNYELSRFASACFMSESVVPLLNHIKTDSNCSNQNKLFFAILYILFRPLLLTMISIQVWNKFGFSLPFVMTLLLTCINIYWGALIVKRGIQENIFSYDSLIGKTHMRHRTPKKSKKIE